jgi:uncharacterized protein DUF4446
MSTPGCSEYRVASGDNLKSYESPAPALPATAPLVVPIFAASDELTSTAGVVALVAGAVALVALILSAVLASRIRRLQKLQSTILGNSGERDLVNHAVSMQYGFDQLHRDVQSKFEQLDARLASNEQGLERSISRSAVIRYDAYGEMSGRQSTSIALLDETGTGVVMSSILHREQARVYAKGVRDGQSDVELSPEENEAIEAAQAGRQPPA